MKKIFTLMLFAGSVFGSKAQTCFPIDTSFGMGGKAIGINNVNNWHDTRNLIVQPDNKIIQFASNQYTQFLAIRYKADGKPDSSFGLYGKTAISAGRVSAGALQGDGKIVMAGWEYSLNANYQKIVLLRLKVNGTMDSSFGVTGKVTTSISSNNDVANGLAIQPDGKILVAGYTSSSCSNDCNGWPYCKPYFTVIRYNNNGTPDTSFGQNGVVAMGVGPFNSGIAYSVVVQPDAKIVVAGESHTYYCDDYYGGSTYSSGFIMARFHPDGSPDITFGQNGQVRDTVSIITSSAFAMQPDGKFLAAGYNNNMNGYSLTRYNSNGSIDNGFVPITQDYAFISSIAVGPNGKIIIGGRKFFGLGDFLIVRLNNDGQFDSTFNLNGRLSVDVGSAPYSEDLVTSIGLQGNNIIAGGYSYYYTSPAHYFSVLAIRLQEPLTGISAPVTPAGPVYPCQGFSTTLNTTVQGNYQWYKDGVLLVGATSQQYNASEGGYYSVKISNASGCGHSEPVLVAINGLPVNITPNSSTNICQGDSVKLVSSEAGILQWYLNGFPITNAKDTILWAKAQGNYYVTVNNAKGCGTSYSIYVIVSPSKPPVTWNGSVLGTSNGYTGYQWFLNGNAIAGATAPTFQPDTTGLYKVVISGISCSPESDEFNLNCSVIAVSKPNISWTGTHLATATGYLGYKWYFNDNPIANGTTYSIIPQQTGIYKLEVRGKFSCSNISNNFTLTCNEVGPPKPPITWDGVKFFTNPGFTSYQWYYNDTAISGATADTYTPPSAQFGKYKVQVLNSYNCGRFSDEKLNAITSVGNIGQTKFTYFPNPVKNIFYIDVLQPPGNNMMAWLYDLNGRLLLRQSLVLGLNKVPIQNLPSGYYHLEIRSGADKSILKLAVIK